MPISPVVATEITEGIDGEFEGRLAESPAPELPPVDLFADRHSPSAPAVPPVDRSGQFVPSEAEPERVPAESAAATSAFDAFPVGPYGAPTARNAARGDSGRWLDAHLLTVLAVAGALPALRMPRAWVVVCAIAGIVMLAVASVRGQAKEKGSADVVVVPARVAGKMLLGAINPLNWLKVLLGALASLTVGAAVAAALAAARWIVDHGTDGILAAVRSGVWADAPRYGAVFACFLLLRGIGKTHERRAARLFRGTRKLPEMAIAAVAVFVAVAGVSLALAGPRADVGFISSSDGLGWVPPGLRSVVDGLRDDAIAEELGSITSCLNVGQAGLWASWYTTDNSLDDPDVVTLYADPTRPPDQNSLAAVALVAHNHLAPWVERFDVSVGDQVMLTVERTGLARGEPLTDAALLRAHAVGTPEWLTTTAPTVDTEMVLHCSARTPL